MLLRSVQPSNAKLPMLVTQFGITMLLRSVQPLNAKLLILVTLSGITMPVRLAQPEKAEAPMLVTLSGIAMPVRPVQPENAELSMPVTMYPSIVSGILTTVSSHVPSPVTVQVSPSPFTLYVNPWDSFRISALSIVSPHTVHSICLLPFSVKVASLSTIQSPPMCPDVTITSVSFSPHTQKRSPCPFSVHVASFTVFQSPHTCS